MLCVNWCAAWPKSSEIKYNENYKKDSLYDYSSSRFESAISRPGYTETYVSLGYRLKKIKIKFTGLIAHPLDKLQNVIPLEKTFSVFALTDVSSFRSRYQKFASPFLRVILIFSYLFILVHVL